MGMASLEIECTGETMRRTSFVSLASGGLATALGMLGNSPAIAEAASSMQLAPAACPSHDIKQFVAAFAEDPALQKVFTATTVDTAFVDHNAQPEPTEKVEPLPRSQLRFPVMPNRARQAKEGLQYRYVSADANRAVVALQVPDTDAQLTYTFRRDRCWTLIKIVDPSFGKAFPAQTASRAVPRARELIAVDDRYDMLKGLSKTFAECMARAKSQDIARAACLTAERDRQDARLNKVFKELIENLQGDRRNRMVEAQRAWIQLQQKDGEFEASIFDELGSEGNLQAVEHEARAISARADLLERYLNLSKL